MMIKASYLLAVIFSTLPKDGRSLNNGLALTPPMGWLAWERYRCTIDCDLYPYECISEWLFRNVTDLLVSEGFADLGYEYVIVDDCWLAPNRDENGRLQPDPKRFPSGMKSLADYIHSKGLKFGIYEDYGTKTCAGYPGIIGHMKKDAETFAEWEVDYVKLDGCYADTKTMDKGYPKFGKLLNQTGRPMVYSCSWPVYQEEKGISPNFTALVEFCNLWRNYDDIQDSWASVSDIMDYFAKKQDKIAEFAGPGHWNDPDMLIIGNFGLSEAQSQAQMAVWSVLAAPLLISTDIANLTPQLKAILQNQRVIAVNQDPLGIQGRRVLTNCGVKDVGALACSDSVCSFHDECHLDVHDCDYVWAQKKKDNIHVWTRPISPMAQNYYSYAVAFVSRRTDGMPYFYNTTLNSLGLYNPNGYRVSDLFSQSYKEKRMDPSDCVEAFINPTGVVFLEFKAVSGPSEPFVVLS